MSLEAIPMDLEGANEFVARHHRHHKPVVGHKFSIGADRISDAMRRVPAKTKQDHFIAVRMIETMDDIAAAIRTGTNRSSPSQGVTDAV